MSGLVVIVSGALLCLAGTVAARQGDALEQASTLAEAGDTAAALSALQAVDARYEETFWGIPQGPLLNALSCLGFSHRADIRLRLAEMAYREGERLLGCTPARSWLQRLERSSMVRRRHRTWRR